jgi:hypothetical protein
MTPGTVSISKRQKTEFAEKGFLLIRNREIVQCKKNLHRILGALAARILAKQTANKDYDWRRLSRRPFKEQFDECIAHEKNNAISRIFYELFPAAPELLSLVSHPLFYRVARQIGVSVPIPSTAPIMRIDRPEEDRYLTPVHQDYWYSMLSPNSITFWMPLFPITEEMGYLSLVPGSHKLGLLPTKPWTDNNPFVAAREFSESEFISTAVGDDEMLVFSQMLVHRSASNRGKNARLTLQVRYNDLETMQEITSSFTPKYSPYVIRAQEKAQVNPQPEIARVR